MTSYNYRSIAPWPQPAATAIGLVGQQVGTDMQHYFHSITMTPEVVEEEEEEEENENENAEEDEEDENAEEGDDEDTDVDTSPTVITQASTNITDQTTLEQWSQRFQAPEKTMQWCSQTPSYAAKVHGQSKVADQSRVHDATEAITSHTGSECRILSALTVKFRVLFKRDREMAM